LFCHVFRWQIQFPFYFCVVGVVFLSFFVHPQPIFVFITWLNFFPSLFFFNLYIIVLITVLAPNHLDNALLCVYVPVYHGAAMRYPRFCGDVFARKRRGGQRRAMVFQRNRSEPVDQYPCQQPSQ
jgi:hypothetical protein